MGGVHLGRVREEPGVRAAVSGEALWARRQDFDFDRRRTGAALVARRARAVLSRRQEEPVNGGGHSDQSGTSGRAAASAVRVAHRELGRGAGRQALPGCERTGDRGRRSENAGGGELVRGAAAEITPEVAPCLLSVDVKVRYEA